MHTAGVSLCIELHEDANWLGGSLYIENLLATLSALPLAERPTVALSFLSSPNSALARRLRNHVLVQNGRTATSCGELMAFMRKCHRATVRRFPVASHLTCKNRDRLYFPAFDTTQKWRKNLYWIPDFQAHHLPELFESRELRLRLQAFQHIAEAKGIVLLSSQAALADFQRFYPAAKAKPRVWSFCSTLKPGSPEQCCEISARYNLPERFLYVANQFWRHKDHTTLFAAIRILRDQGLNIPVVCTGLQQDRRQPDYFPALMKDLEQLNLQQLVMLKGVIPREEQVQFFRRAAAVVQPSRFEGWSTVIEDAKALGRPVIASNIAVHQEQLHGLDNAYLFEVGDAASLADRIAEIWNDLQAGPDLEREDRAVEHVRLVRLRAARQFVQIMNDAVT